MLFLKALSFYLSLLLQFQLFLQFESALSAIDKVPVQTQRIFKDNIHPSHSLASIT